MSTCLLCFSVVGGMEWGYYSYQPYKTGLVSHDGLGHLPGDRKDIILFVLRSFHLQRLCIRGDESERGAVAQRSLQEYLQLSVVDPHKKDKSFLLFLRRL